MSRNPVSQEIQRTVFSVVHELYLFIESYKKSTIVMPSGYYITMHIWCNNRTTY